MEIVINPEGQAQCVYGEEIRLGALGIVQISRASHVEPDEQGEWWADLSPVKGPKLGPYTLRSEALEGELAWLKSHFL